METRQLTVDLVTGMKTNKKGDPYISVKSGNDWWYVGDRSLFALFKKGKKLNCIVEAAGDFKRIVDIVSDDLGIIPREGEESPSLAPQPNNWDRLFKEMGDIKKTLQRIEDNQNPPLQ